MKNLNSFKAIARAIEGERERQIELLEMGKAVVQETRRWDDNKETSYAMRSKEDARDYRYFPDPDLVPVSIDDAFLEEIRARQPEFRTEKMARYKEEYDIPEYDVWYLMIDKSNQRQGYGSAALDQVLDYIKMKPFGSSDRITLTCNKDNIHALNLYKKQRFYRDRSNGRRRIELSLMLQ